MEGSSETIGSISYCLIRSCKYSSLHVARSITLKVSALISPCLSKEDRASKNGIGFLSERSITPLWTNVNRLLLGVHPVIASALEKISSS